MFGPKKTCLNKRWRTLQNNAIAIRHICNLARLAPCAPQSICFYIKHIFLYCSFLPESYPHVVWPTIAAAEAGEVARGRGRDEEVGLPRLELKLPWRRRKISKERYFQAQLFLVNLCWTLSLCSSLSIFRYKANFTDYFVRLKGLRKNENLYFNFSSLYRLLCPARLLLSYCS